MFMPNYLIGAWLNPDENNNEWCSVMIWMGPGVCGDDDFKLSVSDCGTKLEYTIS